MTNTHMSTAQATKRNAASFRQQLMVLHSAAIGVVQVRTTEPFRAIEAIRDFAYAEEKNFRFWNIVDGWVTISKSNPDAKPTTDSLSDPFQALMALTGKGGGNAFETDNSKGGIYCMVNPHKPLAQNLKMIHLLKEYAKTFPLDSKYRLLLITPPSFSMPEELREDVVILDFDPPSYAELRDVLVAMIEGIRNPAKRPNLSATDLELIVNNGTGMTKQEFENAVSRALVSERARLPNVTAADIAGHVGNVKTEVVMRSEVLELMEPVPIDTIGGLDNLKDWAIKRSRTFSQTAREFGIEPPKGIALIGPPGTGKTLCGKAIASVLGIPMLKLDVGRIFQSLVGQSEQRVREATKLVDTMAPCVLLIDEADKAFQVGSGGDSGVGQRVLGTLLTWMQETKSPVFLVVTANRTENLPAEFLRRGRLDEVFSVTIPNEDERREIIKIHLRKRKQEPDQIADLDAAVMSSQGYVSAELEAAVKDAVIEAYIADQAVTGQLIADQLAHMVPLSVAFKTQFDAMEEWARNNARPASREGGARAVEKRDRRRVPSTSANPLSVGARATNLDS